MTTNLCDCGRPAPDATLCPLCTKQLGEWLASIPAWLHELNVARFATASTQRLGRIRGGETPLPCRIDIAQLVDQLRHDLEWWSRHVARKTRENPPTRSRAAIWLAQRHVIIAADEDASALLDVLDEHRRAVLRIVDLPATRHVHVGACPHVDCCGVISAELHDSRALVLECNGCRQTWEAHQLRRLSRQMSHAVAR